jgi:hypothetical protein
MDKGRVILALGSMALVCAAVAMMVSTDRPAAGNTHVPAAAPALNLPTPSAPPAGAPLAGAPPAATPTPANPVPQTTPAPTVEAAAMTSDAAPQSGAEIWECTTNGQKTFSDKPCGDKPVRRELSALNVMNPTPILPVVHSYEEHYYGPEPGYPEYSDPGMQEPAESSYPVVVGYPVLGYGYAHRRRPDHVHRPRPQPHGPTARKIQ